MGTYELLEELGRGGMGVVHRARHRESGREVALKLLLPGADSGDDDARRFRRETEALKELTHPNIVRVLDSGEMDGRWFYAMELVAGQSLDRLLLAGPFDLTRLARVIKQAAGALAACHARGFLHRDIKPGNLMITQADHVTLMDFGLVKVDGRTVLTATGEVVGTPHYVSPELLRGEPAVQAGDVYALGVVLLELAGGKPPFAAQTMGALLVEIVGTGPRPLESLRPDAPAPLADLARRMVALDPAARPTAAQIVAELERLSPGGTQRRTGKSPASRPRVTRSVPASKPPGERFRAPLAAALALVLCVAAGLAWRARQTPVTQGSASPDPVVSAVADSTAPRVTPNPPRGAQVARADGRPWPAGTAWTVLAAGRAVSAGRLEREAERLSLTGLEPAGAYQLEVAGAPPVTFQTPRMALGHLRLAPGETAVAVSFWQPGHETFTLTVERPGGEVVWKESTREAALFAAVRNLHPATPYELHARVEGAGLAFQPSGIPFRTQPAGFVALHRSKLASLSTLAMMADAGDLALHVERLVELLPEMLTALHQAVARHEPESIGACADAIGETFDPRGLPEIANLLAQVRDAGLVHHAFGALGNLHRPEAFDLILKYGRDVEVRPVDDPGLYAFGLAGSDWARAQEHFRAVAREPEKHAPVDRPAVLRYLLLADAEELVPLLMQPALARLDGEAAGLAGFLCLIEGAVPRDALRALVTEALARSAPALDAAVMGLGRTGDTASAPLIARVLASPDAHSRRVATGALGMVGGPAAESQLLALLDDRDPHVRRRAAMGLGRMRARGAVDTLGARLVTDAESLGRIPRALGMIGDPRAAPALLDRLKRPVRSTKPRDADDVDRAEAVWALGQLREPGVRPIAEQMLASGSDYARLRAAEALGWLGDKSALPAIVRAAARRDMSKSAMNTVSRVQRWLEGKGHAPARVFVIDASEPTAGRFCHLFPGEGVAIQHSGTWAPAPGAELVEPEGVSQDDRIRLRLIATCRTQVDYPFADRPLWIQRWNGGAVEIICQGAEPEGVGFVACWTEVPQENPP